MAAYSYHQPNYRNQQQVPNYGNQQQVPNYGNQQQMPNYGNQQRSPVPTPRQRSTIPRSISSTNLAKTVQCRQIILQDWQQNPPRGGTNFFPTVPSFSLTLPSLDGYPSEFRQFVFEKLIDKMTQQYLESERCLNWCSSATKLIPLNTTGDGNCLLHAASLAMWGFQDRDLTLRRALLSALQNQAVNDLWRRWKHHKEIDNRSMGLELEEYQWANEWGAVVANASLEAPAGQALKSLDDFHVFVLCNILRRPIIMYACPKVRSMASGGTLQHINFHGIYLPLLWEPASCKKDPLPIAYNAGHFVALVAVENPPQYHAKSFSLPLMDYYGQMLPVRYLLGMEDPTTLLMDYLNSVSVTGHGSPYVTSPNVRCASMSAVDTSPAYLKTLLGGFVDACSQVYYGQPAPQNPAPQNPAPQRLSQSFEHNKPPNGFNAEPAQQSDPPVQSQKCINDCGMYGDPQRGGLCSKCYQRQAYEYKDPPNAASGFKQPQQDDPSAGRTKCINDCGMFGDPKQGGLCSKCYQRHVQNAQLGNDLSTDQQAVNKCINHCGNTIGPDNAIGLCNRCLQRQKAEQPGNGFQQNNMGEEPQFQQRPQPDYGNAQGGSIKCPNCSDPGHPNFLGMCQRCYGTGSLGQQQPQQQAQTEHIYEAIPGAAVPEPDPEERRPCRTPGCEFYGPAHTAFYCSRCFERDMEKILREADAMKAPPPHHPPAFQQSVMNQQPPLPPRPRESFQQNPQVVQPAPGGGPKCPNCHNFFADPSFGGMCSNCFMEMTKKDQEPPRPQVPPRLPEPTYVPHNTPVYSPCRNPSCPNMAGDNGWCAACDQSQIQQRTAPVMQKCMNPDCYQPASATGYCESCSVGVRQHSATSVQRPIPKPRRMQSLKHNATSDSQLASQMGGMQLNEVEECFLCNGGDGQKLCRGHAEAARRTLQQPLQPTDYEEPVQRKGSYVNQEQFAARSVSPGLQQNGTGYPPQQGYRPGNVSPTPQGVQQSGRQFGVPIGTNAGQHQPHQPAPQQPPPQQGRQFGVPLNPQGAPSAPGATGGASGGHYGTPGAAGGGNYGMAGNAPVEKLLCGTAGCSFKGYKELYNLCPDCYELYYNLKAPEQFPLV